jgi:hypothetical protein
MAVPSIRLLYFACRGRGFALRLFLSDSGYEWEDLTQDINFWFDVKYDQSRTGPLGQLPTLVYQESKDGSHSVHLNETLGIAAFLSRKLEPHSSIDDFVWGQSMSVSSKVYLDISSPLFAICWAPIRLKGVNLSEYASRIKDGVTSIFNLFETNFFNDGRTFVCNTPIPTIGDYFLFEALDTYLMILGEELLLLKPHLTSFHKRMSEREGIKRLFQTCTFLSEVTKSPHEDEVRRILVDVWKK